MKSYKTKAMSKKVVQQKRLATIIVSRPSLEETRKYIEGAKKRKHLGAKHKRIMAILENALNVDGTGNDSMHWDPSAMILLPRFSKTRTNELRRCLKAMEVEHIVIP